MNNGAEVPESLVRPIWQERVYEDWGLIQSEARVISELRKQGYVFATAKSSFERSEDEIRIVHEVNPGRKYAIYNVDFEGLTLFSPAELERELGLGLGLLTGIGGEKLFEMPRRVEQIYADRGYGEARAEMKKNRAETCQSPGFVLYSFFETSSL